MSTSYQCAVCGQREPMGVPHSCRGSKTDQRIADALERIATALERDTPSDLWARVAQLEAEQLALTKTASDYLKRLAGTKGADS